MTLQEIKDFNEKFVNNKREDGEDFTLYYRDDAIKSFINSLLSTRNSEAVKFLKGMKEMTREYPMLGILPAYDAGYDNAVSDMLNYYKDKE